MQQIEREDSLIEASEDEYIPNKSLEMSIQEKFEDNDDELDGEHEPFKARRVGAR